MNARQWFRGAALAAAVAMVVAGCGGGGGGGGAGTAAPGASVGVLTDSPIEGVQYTTSGGYTGLTDANGNYNYNPGETVTFRIGNIDLGTVTASGTVTPIDLAAGNANRVTNLLVLLQSLDSDGDPSTRITITPAARTAAAGTTLNLDVAPATFASGANTALTTLIGSAGTVNTAPVDPAAALAHFREQFFQTLMGGWVAVDENNDVVVIRFEKDGTYAIGETGVADSSGMAGLETGTITWDPATGRIAATVSRENNGEWGLSHMGSADTLRFDGDNVLVYHDSVYGGETRFTRVANDPSGIVGLWGLNAPAATTRPTDARTWQTFAFLANGRYMMIDPVGDEDGNCAVARGIEFGRYAVTGGNLQVTAAPNVDQNGCAGLWDQPAASGINEPVTFGTGGVTMTIGGRTLFRLSR